MSLVILTKAPLDSGFDAIPYSALYVLYREEMCGCKLSLSASLSLNPVGSFMVWNGFVFGDGQSRREGGLRESLGKCNQPVGLMMVLKQAHHSSTDTVGSQPGQTLPLAYYLQHTGHQIESNSKTVLRRALHTFFSILTEPAAPTNPDVFPVGLRSTSHLWQSSNYVGSEKY